MALTMHVTAASGGTHSRFFGKATVIRRIKKPGSISTTRTSLPAVRLRKPDRKLDSAALAAP